MSDAKNIYLITGASSDVGTALIEYLYKDGDIFIAQGSNDLQKLAPLKQKLGDALITYDVDLTNENEIDKFVNDVLQNGNEPTHLVHLPALRVINAKFKKFDEQRFALDMNVQITSAVQICKAFLPLMAKAKKGRVLFMLTSYLMGAPPKNTAAYIMAKSALQGLAKSLAADYASFGITVNSVMPSMMQTAFLDETSDLIIEAAAQAHPLKRNATVDDVVPVMAFLLSDEARFITGVSLPITGGSAIL